MAPLLAALLSLATDARYPPLDMSPHRQKERTLEVLVDQLLGLAARRPVLALYEDVHWADPTSLELLDLVVDRVQGAPALVLITFRPEFVPPWTRYAHVTALTLSRLSRRQGAAMVERLSAGKALPATVLDQIVAKTDGVPLFVEELTRAVLETNLLRDEGDHYALAGPLPPMAIPTTLQESLLARLDRLAPAREVAQVAAAIGREFSHELLAVAALVPESDLQAALDDLVELGTGVPARHAAPGDLQLQACARPGRCLCDPRAREAAAVARPYRRCDRAAFSRDGAGAARTSRPPLHGGGACRTGDRVLAQGRATGHRPLSHGRGARAVAERVGPARGLAGDRSAAART